MDIKPLKPLIDQFIASQASDEIIAEQKLEHARRGENAQRLFQLDRISSLTREELEAFFRDTDAWFGLRWNKHEFLSEIFGANNEKLGPLQEFFSDLVRRGTAGLAAADFNWLLERVRGIGPAYLSEILGLRFPERYWLLNKQVQSFFKAHGVDLKEDLPRGKRGDKGEEYMAAGRHLSDLRGALTDAIGKPVDYMFTDLFIYWANKQKSIEVVEEVKGAGAAKEPAKVRSGAFEGFTDDTFLLLQELKANNNFEWMHENGGANTERFKRVLREPLRMLFEAVAPMISALDPNLETDVKFGKVLAGIKKRWPDEAGPYHPYLWGAFYRRPKTKQTDAQLFVIVHPDHVNVGVSVAGSRGADVLSRFHRNLKEYPDLFLQLLRKAPDGTQVSVAPRHGVPEKQIVTVHGKEDLAPLVESELINIERTYPADSPVLRTPKFAEDVADLFETLYPFYLFCTADDVRNIPALMQEQEDEEETELDLPATKFTFEQLIADTFSEETFWKRVEFLLQDKG